MSHIWTKPIILSPSLICLDQCNLEAQIRELEHAGVELLHVDILDGHFSPSMPLGLEAVWQLRAKTDMAFDVHLMVENPLYFIDELLDIGVQQIVFQVETAPHADWLLSHIHGVGVRAGIALKPATSLATLDYLLEQCDAVLLMLINPGYASNAKESQVPYGARKIKELRALISARNPHALIELDGRVSPANISAYGKELADVFVAGSTCMKKNALEASLADLFALRKQVLGE